RLQALAFEFGARLRRVAAREFELQAVAFAPQRIAFVFEHFGLRDRARRLDPPLGDVGPILAIAAARFTQLQQRGARTCDLRRRVATQYRVRHEAFEAGGELGVFRAGGRGRDAGRAPGLRLDRRAGEREQD